MSYYRRLAQRARSRRQERDDLHYPADVLAKVLFHVHGKLPVFADDFRNSEHSSYPSEYGQHTVTKNGDPTNADPLGDTDGSSLDGWSTSDYLDAGDLPDLDFGADESFSIISLLGGVPNSPTNTSTMCGKRPAGGGAGYLLYMPPSDYNKPAGFISDGSNHNDNLKATTTVDDGNPHSSVYSVDRGSDDEHIHIDGVEENSSDISGIGSLANNGKHLIGLRPDGTREPFLGPLGGHAVHPQWIPEEVAAYLHEILINDRTKYAPQLDVWTYGTPRKGFSRSLPTWLTDAFGSSGPDFWWSAKRHVHQKDGEGCTQVPNYAGGDRFGVQRTDTDKLTANGDTERGHPVDNLETTGNQYAEIPGESVNDGDVFTFGFVGVPRGGTLFGISDDFNTFGEPGISVRIDIVSDGDFQVRITGDSNGTFSYARTWDDSGPLAAVFTYEINLSGTSHAYCTVRDTTGSTYTVSPSVSNISMTQSDPSLWIYAGNSPGDGTLEDFIYEKGTLLTDAEADTFRDTLYSEYNL